MQPISRLLIYIALAAFIWIADALLLCFFGAKSFAGALWQDASPLRLLIRLSTVAFLVLAGCIDVFRREVLVDQYKRLTPASRLRLFGDPNSKEAPLRMQYHALRLAAVMRMHRREQERLRLLCHCYDIGSTFAEVKGEITHGHMNDWDRYLLGKHTDYGVSIAKGIPQLASVAPLIGAHEENYDGSGPKGMFGRGIPLSCRIFRVIQLFDYFTQPNEERPAMTIPEALDELSFYSGTLLDPDVLKAFRKLMSDDTIGERIMASIYINS